MAYRLSREERKDTYRLATSLKSAFDWESTPQGWTYWNTVCDNLAILAKHPEHNPESTVTGLVGEYNLDPDFAYAALMNSLEAGATAEELAEEAANMEQVTDADPLGDWHGRNE